MKALIISALLFFSLRAISAEVGESLASSCVNTNQSAKREAKVIADTVVKDSSLIKSQSISK